MDFKLFMNSVEENLSLIKTEEELRNWIRNYARSIPEEERGSFLEQIQIRKSRSHNEILQELTDWCAKIEEGEITLSCSGYEEYGESWWDRDWVTEYEDPMGIGAQLKCYYEEAEQAVYDRDYESAGQMYWSLGVLNITADDVYGGEPAELGNLSAGSCWGCLHGKRNPLRISVSCWRLPWRGRGKRRSR